MLFDYTVVLELGPAFNVRMEADPSEGAARLRWTDLGPQYSYTVESTNSMNPPDGKPIPDEPWPAKLTEWTITEPAPFGRETAGLPRPLVEKRRDQWIRIPMFNPSARSLNLSNCVALVLYEALRQLGFPAEI